MGYILSLTQCGSSFSEFDALDSESCGVVWTNVYWQPLSRSRSLKVTAFSTDRKPASDFLLANTSCVQCPVSQHSWVITAYWSNYRSWHGCKSAPYDHNARPSWTDGQTDRLTNIIAIAWRFVLMNASRAKTLRHILWEIKKRRNVE